MKLLATLSLLLLLTAPTRAQIGMGSGTPHPSAALELQATDKAFYPPKLTTIQRKAIVNPQSGAFVYDLDKGTFYLFDGVNWLPLAFTSANSPLPIDRTATGGVPGDYFGYSVAISGDYAIVGSLRATVFANIQQGLAYVFVRSGGTWTQQAILYSADGESLDEFGGSVAISGNYALVGSSRNSSGVNASQGAVYAFVRSGSIWTQQAKLTATDGATNDYFGNSVAISGDFALVGALIDDVGSNTDQGSAYVFVRSGSSWTQQAKLVANDGAAGDRFGISVAISNEYGIVGSDLDNVGANTKQGSAYVFVRSGSSWTQQAKLTATGGATNNQFGFDVGISGSTALVGSLGGGTTSDQGAAFVFVRSGSSWTQQAKLTPSDGEAGDGFGRKVALSGDFALVGSIFDRIGDNVGQGSAYLYKRSGANWTQVRKITDNSPAGTGNGSSVDINNGTFIIGGLGFQNNQGKVGFGTVDN